MNWSLKEIDKFFFWSYILLKHKNISKEDNRILFMK